MSFGYSIGDFIAIAGVIERIVAEVKSYNEAPLHFQRLAIELDLLSKVCHQAFELRPSISNDLVQLERVRAIALHALGPLRDFEEKMRGYENTLGPRAFMSSGKKSFGVKRLSEVKKRLHWSAIARHEVDELRAILTSAIFAVNTLLTMQNWQGLETDKIANRAFAEQLTSLMNTTEAAAGDIRNFLVSSQATAERLEAAVASAHSAELERTRTMGTIGVAASETSRLVSSVRDTVGQTSSQLTKLFSLTRHLENWIKAIVQYCKDIIGQVRRNTGLLLSLHRIIANLELTLRRSGIDLPILELENPFGIRMALPYQLCDTWEGMCRMLVVMFFDKPGLRLVERRRFVLLQAQTNFAIRPETWSTSVAPGDKLAMSMAVERVTRRQLPGSSTLTCPRCDQKFQFTSPTVEQGHVCHRCLLWWSDATEAISADAATLSVPRPPPEPIRWDSWKEGWNWRFRRPEALSMLQKAALPFERAPGADLDDNADVSSFRRIHVVPFRGDILRSLIDAGTAYRNFLLRYAAGFDPDSPQLSPNDWESLKNTLDELDTLRKTDISPTAEVDARHGSQAEKAVISQWISRTIDLLLHLRTDPLLRPRVPDDQIDAILDWLRSRPKRTRQVYQPDDDYVGNYAKRMYSERLNSRVHNQWELPGSWIGTAETAVPTSLDVVKKQLELEEEEYDMELEAEEYDTQSLNLLSPTGYDFFPASPLDGYVPEYMITDRNFAVWAATLDELPLGQFGTTSTDTPHL